MKKAVSGSLQALTRTAQWNVDDAQLLHGQAIERVTQSKKLLDSARVQLEGSHDRLRQLLKGTVLNADALQYQHLQITHHQNQLMAYEQQHQEHVQQSELTRQQLLDAKIRKETYVRLGERREQDALHQSRQQLQRVADESGVTRTFANTNSFLSIEEEQSYGN